MEQITLYFKEGRSDKVYQAAIESKDGGCVVTFAYGRRGSTLTTGTKTQRPVAYDAAKQIYGKLVAEKMAKGYTPGEDGTPYRHTDQEQSATGIHCQLLNFIPETEVDQLLENPAFWLQEKFDGRRLLIKREGATVTGINRLGLTVAVPEPIASAAEAFPGAFVMDGEAVGERLHAFDLLFLNALDIRHWPYQDRYLQLMDMIGSNPQSAIKLVTSAVLPGQKRAVYTRCRDESKEGVVFKRSDTPYIAGKPASGGTQFKFKFTESASFIVNKVNDKRSVSLTLFAGDRVVPAGNVTIPPNHEIPAVGAVVECRYLYAFPESGVIFQPVYLGQRDDIPAEECVTAQLKYKPETVEEVA